MTSCIGALRLAVGIRREQASRRSPDVLLAVRYNKSMGSTSTTHSTSSGTGQCGATVRTALRKASAWGLHNKR